jgi:hypothetical protein
MAKGDGLATGNGRRVGERVAERIWDTAQGARELAGLLAHI